MKFKKLLPMLLALSFLLTLTVSAADPDVEIMATGRDEKKLLLCPGGMPVGVRLTQDGVTVVGMAEFKADGKTVCPASDAGIKSGDLITRINGRDVSTSEDVTKRVEACKGEGISVSVRRDGKDFNLSVFPAQDTDGNYRIGVWVKDNTSGIGTVTYITPEGNDFGGLGHGICDQETGSVVEFRKGVIFDVTVSGVIKGKSGLPGQIKGFFGSDRLGLLSANTDCGIFGVLSGTPSEAGKPVEIIKKDKLKEGKAEILCTLGDDGVQKYEVEISQINTSEDGNKCFVVKVADPKLIERTGGIVQGMSGSPILQNGKLAGAITHVLVSDPTKGYGIFIENMLNNAPTQKKK